MGMMMNLFKQEHEQALLLIEHTSPIRTLLFAQRTRDRYGAIEITCTKIVPNSDCRKPKRTREVMDVTFAQPLHTLYGQRARAAGRRIIYDN